MNTTMNTVNQIFNWSRFTATLRKEVVENWRAILFTMIGTFGLLTMIMIMGNFIGSDSDSMRGEMITYTKVPQKVVFGMLSMAAIVVASLSFRKLTTKSGRIDMFTSPSSTLEKFVVNGVVYVLGYIVVFFILAQLADLTRIGVMHAIGYDDDIPGPINFLNTTGDVIMGIGSSFFNGPWAQVYIWSSLLATPGLYLLGSIVWPRLSLLKTFAAVYAVEFVLGIVFAISVFIFGDWEDLGMWIFNKMDMFVPFLTILVIVEAIVAWSLAWYLFKRKDVISLKWWK